MFGSIRTHDGARVAGAVITARPFGVTLTTDANGGSDLVIPVGTPGCAWTAVEVGIAGYGAFTMFDIPLLAGTSFWDPIIEPGVNRRFIGAPLAEGTPVKPEFCARGAWIAP